MQESSCCIVTQEESSSYCRSVLARHDLYLESILEDEAVWKAEDYITAYFLKKKKINKIPHTLSTLPSYV